MGTFGLTYQIGADTAAAQAATEQLEAQTREFFGLVKSGAESTVPAVEQAGDAIGNRIGGSIRQTREGWEQLNAILAALMPEVNALPPALERVDVKLAPQISSLTQLKDAFLGLTESTRTYTREQIEGMLQAGDITVQQAGRMVEALKRETEAQVLASARQGLALLSAIASRRATAAVEAVWETAKAYAAFAEFDFWAGAQHLLAAAQYGLVAGGVGAGGGVGGGRTATGRVGLAAAAVPGVFPAFAPGSAPSAAAAQLTVLVMGPDNAANWLVNNVLNPYTGKGGTLVASHTRRPPYAGR